MTRVLRALPEDMHNEKQRLVIYIHAVLDGCLAHQREDGLFHDVIDDPSSFIETNLAQMLAYTIYRGVAGGWLQATYLETADRMRGTAHGKIDKYGLVQDVCGAPSFDHPGVATEGQAHEQVFTVECHVNGQEPVKATGPSRRKAEQAAAALILEGMENV